MPFRRLLPYTGNGSPEGVLTAIVGTLYQDLTNGELYKKHAGSGNTGWARIIRSNEFITHPDTIIAGQSVTVESGRQIWLFGPVVNNGTIINNGRIRIDA